jgi:diacylglycerol kinase family enzyme
MSAFLIVNPHSGAGAGRRVAEAAAARGIRVHVLAPGEKSSDVARNADADVLAVAGGDGSLAPVAQVAIERDIPFACIPTGTYNHFARDLGLDRRDPESALELLSSSSERRVDVGYANDRLFLNNVSLGAYAQLVHEQRRGSPFARLRTLAILTSQREAVPLTLDGAPVRSRVVLVANNAYSLDVLSLGARDRLDEGLLHVYVEVGRLRPTWEERSTGRLVVDTPSARLRAAVDGEAEVLETPIAFRIETLALRVLAPALPR